MNVLICILTPKQYAARGQKTLMIELKQVVAAGCDFNSILDEPMWTESPEHSEWAAGILNEMIEELGAKVRIGLHVCGVAIPVANGFTSLNIPTSRLLFAGQNP